MDGHHNCPTHRKLCINRKEENYFFRLSRYQKEIEVSSLITIGLDSFD